MTKEHNNIRYIYTKHIIYLDDIIKIVHFVQLKKWSKIYKVQTEKHSFTVNDTMLIMIKIMTWYYNW